MLTACPSRRPDRSDVAIALAVAALGLAALLFPAALLRVAPPCLFLGLFELPCWGCGMTRAALALLRGDIATAWQYNKASLLVLPMLMLLYARHLHMVLRGLRLPPYARRK